MLRELIATTVTQTVRLGRLVDMTTSLLRQRDNRPVASISPYQGGNEGGHAARDGGPGPASANGMARAPKPLPPYFAEIMHTIYGVNFNPQMKQTQPIETEQTGVSAKREP